MPTAAFGAGAAPIASRPGDGHEPTKVAQSSIIYDTPRRLTNVDVWHDHIPFAFLTVELLQPRVFVELGVQGGDSYCAFCQAVDRLAAATRCYGVDTWRGDANSGLYGDESLAGLRAHHDPIYGRFSRLVQSTFDEAVEHFPDSSIDLLHINGLHTYEAVRHDFETWQPKLSDRAVVLFHDVNVREAEFGVWKFWAEVSEHRPSLTLSHGSGLGIVALGPDVPRQFKDFLTSAADPREPTSRMLYALGNRVALLGRMRNLATELTCAQDRLAATERERGDLMAHLDRLDGELKALRPELLSHRAEVDRLRLALDELDRRRADVARLTGDLDRARSEAVTNDQEARRLRSTLAESDAKLGAARKELARVRAQLAGSSEELSRLRPELARSQLEMTRLKVEFEDRSRELADLRISSEACLAAISGRARHTMTLEDERHPVSYDEGNGSSGAPIRYRLVSSTGRHPRGWGIVSYEGWSNQGRLALKLTGKPRVGDHLELRLPDARGGVSALVRFPEQLMSLSLEVLDTPERCTIDTFTVREVGSLRALAGAVSGRIRAETRPFWAVVGSTLAVLRREGLGGVKRWLFLPFWLVPATTGQVTAAHSHESEKAHGSGRQKAGSVASATKHLMTLDGHGTVAWEGGRYRTLCAEAHFQLLSSVGRCPTGWVHVRYRAASVSGVQSLRLVALQQDGTGAEYELPAANGPASAVLRLPDEVTRLSLVPIGMASGFTIDGFTVREIRKREVLLRTAVGSLAPALTHPGQLPALVGKARQVWRREGPMGLKRRLARAALPRSVFHGSPDAPLQVAPAAPARVEPAYRPLISVVMPVYNVPARYLAEAVRSVERQTYDKWELCIGDDGSTNSETVATLRELATRVPRIKVRFGRHGGISAATNSALDLASGDYVAFMDSDDVLTPDALAEYVAVINARPDVEVIYSDEDKIDEAGALSDPFFKPDWSPEFFRGVMFVGHLLMVKRALVEQVGRLDGTYDGVQDFELMLRLSEQSDRIHHHKRIVYHWRKHEGSLSGNINVRPISERQAAAVNAQLERLRIPAIAEPHPVLPHRAVLTPRPRAQPWPTVSVVIPTKDAPEHIGRCLESLFQVTAYDPLEVVVVDNGTTDPRAKAVLARHPVEIVRFDERFSFSRANNLGVARARGDYVLLLNNDTEILDPDWIRTLVFHLELPNVAVVGPLLLYPDGSVQHAGVALGLRGSADHVMRGYPPDADGYAGSLCCTREVMAVTAACLMTRRRHYEEVGGFNEFYATIYQDLDFCLRTWRMGKAVLFTPRTRLIHHESATRGTFYDQLDRALLKDAWDQLIQRGDPFHDPRAPGYSM